MVELCSIALALLLLARRLFTDARPEKVAGAPWKILADEAAAKATEYRDALRAAVPPNDLGGLLKAMLQQGMSGDVSAAKLVFSIMQPAGPPPARPAINVKVVLPGDDDDE